MHDEDPAGAELRSMLSAWRALARDWDLEWFDIRALFPDGSDKLAQPTAPTEQRMRVLIEIGHRLRFDDEGDLRDWLRQPTKALGWLAPLDIMAGPLPQLRSFRRMVELEPRL